MLFGSVFIQNLFVLYHIFDACLAHLGPASDYTSSNRLFPSFLALIISVAVEALIAYILFRITKNYRIRRHSS